MEQLPRYLLGLFILIQLAFLFIANAASVAFYFQSENATAAMLWSAGGALSEPWAHLTAQEQYWRMFAPSVPPRTLFVRMRLHIDDEIVLVPSEFEPLPGRPILHLPGSGERMWHVEKNLANPMIAYDADKVVARLDEWRAYLRQAIAKERSRYLAYMAWRSRHYLAARGDQRIPHQIDLLVSIHSLSSHDRPSVPEFELLMLRWRPALPGNDALQLCIDTAQSVQCEPFDE